MCHSDHACTRLVTGIVYRAGNSRHRLWCSLPPYLDLVLSNKCRQGRPYGEDKQPSFTYTVGHGSSLQGRVTVDVGYGVVISICNKQTVRRRQTAAIVIMVGRSSTLQSRVTVSVGYGGLPPCLNRFQAERLGYMSKMSFCRVTRMQCVP